MATEETKELGEIASAESNSDTNIIMTFLQKIGGWLVLAPLKDNRFINWFLFILWLTFAGIIYSFETKLNQTGFTIRCCSIWFVLMAFLLWGNYVPPNPLLN